MSELTKEERETISDNLLAARDVLSFTAEFILDESNSKEACVGRLALMQQEMVAALDGEHE